VTFRLVGRWLRLRLAAVKRGWRMDGVDVDVDWMWVRMWIEGLTGELIIGNKGSMCLLNKNKGDRVVGPWKRFFGGASRGGRA